MDLDIILPFLSSALSFVFAALVADQWLRRRQSYQLVWTVGLLWYGISAGTEFIGSAFGWNEPLYRTWYLIGAFGVAAYLGLGTVYLLNRTRFGYFVAVSFALAGLFSYLTSVKYAREGVPASDATIVMVVGASFGAAVLIALITRFRRRWIGHVTAAILVVASVVVTVLAYTVPVAAPGYSIDAIGIPVGTAMPSDLRILTPPFNIVGAFALTFGAVYSAYIFMPKARVLRVTTGWPIIGALDFGELFPARYRGGAFIAFHGSWNRAPLSQRGYHVAFVPFDEKGMPAGNYEIFAHGFAGLEDWTEAATAFDRAANFQPSAVMSRQFSSAPDPESG